MDSKQVRGMMEAYASIYEKKGDCVDKKDKGMHNCAKKVCHEEYGEGETIFGQHAVPDENGFVSHYNVQFEHGIVENVSVEDLTILEGYKVHENHEYEGEKISEGPEEYAGGQHPSKHPDKKVRDRYETQRRRAEAPKGVGVPDKSKGYGGNPAYAPESVDTFDIIKGHLIDEGYADTEEAALAIMTNMSEEWRQSIVEGWAEVGANVTDALPWNRNTKYTTQGELRKPGENVYGQQTGRGLNVQTHAVKKDGKNKTTPPPLRPAPLIQQNIPSGVFPPLMPRPRTKPRPDRGREFSHGS